MHNTISKIKEKGFKGTFKALKNRFFCMDDGLWIKLFKNKLKINDNWILFQSEGDFSDNARALFEYMQETYEGKYKYIWLVKEPKDYPRYTNTKFISIKPRFLFGQKTMWYYAYKCKYFFFTHGNWFQDKKAEQTIVNLWHGCGYKGFKGNGQIKHVFDYCLVTGPFYKNIQAEYFSCNLEQVLPLGLPRNDLLFKKSNVAKNLLLKLARIDEYEKIIIWMPTYRKSFSHNLSEDTLFTKTGLPIFETPEHLDEIDNYLGEINIKLILKIHHLQDIAAININKYKNIIMLNDEDLSKEDIQLYEILGYTDALITDYSSVAIDYLLLDRPIAYTLDDYDIYLKSRGFAMEDPLQIMPGKKIYNKDDFYDFINGISSEKDDYKMKRIEINKLVNIKSENFSQNLLDYLKI